MAPQRSRRRKPWGKLLGEPIERYPYEWGDDLARTEQYKKLLALKKYYGIKGETGARPWCELVIAIVSEFDEGLKIVERKPKPMKATTRRWRGAMGYQLVAEVAAFRTAHPGRKLDAVLLEVHQKRRETIPFEQFRKNYHDAKRYVQANPLP